MLTLTALAPEQTGTPAASAQASSKPPANAIPRLRDGKPDMQGQARWREGHTMAQRAFTQSREDARNEIDL